MKNNWKKEKLGDITEIVSGGTPSSINNSYWENGDIFWATLPDLKNKYLYSTERKITKIGLSKSSAKLLPINTVIFSSRATIGEVSITKIITSTNQGSKNFICNLKIIKPEFLYYWLKNNSKMIEQLSGGATYKEINKTDLSNIKIKLPEIEIQQKIASILSAYDDLIEVNNKRIKVLEEMARRIYKEWFVNFKFPGYEKAKFKNDLPEDWEEKEIINVDYFKFCKSKIKKFEGEKEYFATANINGNNITKEGDMVTFENKPSRAQIQPKTNTVWFARMKDSFKVIAYKKANMKLIDKHILSSGMIGFEADENFYGFLYFTICSNWFHDLKDQYATGATQVSLTNEGLFKMRILVPDKKIANKYSVITNTFIDQILILQQINNKLQKSRDLLLPKLMSGEIEIK